jgi:hypothetical protein
MEPPRKTAICMKPRLNPSRSLGTTLDTSATHAATVPVTAPWMMRRNVSSYTFRTSPISASTTDPPNIAR